MRITHGRIPRDGQGALSGPKAGLLRPWRAAVYARLSPPPRSERPETRAQPAPVPVAGADGGHGALGCLLRLRAAAVTHFLWLVSFVTNGTCPTQRDRAALINPHCFVLHQMVLDVKITGSVRMQHVNGRPQLFKFKAHHKLTTSQLLVCTTQHQALHSLHVHSRIASSLQVLVWHRCCSLTFDKLHGKLPSS